MHLIIETKLDYKVDAELTTILLQIETAELPDQRVIEATTSVAQPAEIIRVPADDGVGERAWVRASEKFSCVYRAKVELTRLDVTLSALQVTPLTDLPGDVIKYLNPSRYCLPERFGNIVKADFAGLAGGALVAALRDWVENHLSYVPGASNEMTTATDTYLQREGICRDYAHVMIALARAADIPARFASVYSPAVEPPDFHAVAQVYLDGAWRLVDATGMADPGNMAIIGVGRDAVDVAFMAVHGSSELVEQSVSVQQG
jgi:transglutaminase-like putative cysteine protease